MPDIYKVGLTTNSVHQRIQELSTTTGVPTRFRAEKIFSISASKLRSVEQRAHKKLKNDGFHQGKEFFQCTLDQCVFAVEDAILEVVGAVSIDLIGQAAQRKMQERQRIEQERQRLELEQEELERLLNDLNADIDFKREKYFRELQAQSDNEISFLDKFFWIPIGFVFIGVITVVLLGQLAWVAIPLAAWWFIRSKKNERQQSHMNSAARKYPYVTRSTLSAHQKLAASNRNLAYTQSTASIEITPAGAAKPHEERKNTKVDLNVVVAKRKQEIENLQTIKSDDWVVNSSKSWLYNTRTKELLSTTSGLGFSVSNDWFILANKAQTRKLAVKTTRVDDHTVSEAVAQTSPSF